MNEDKLVTTLEGPLSRWAQHRFMLLVGLTILASLFLVGVALALYASSGAEQLDLSRPGYVLVRQQAIQSDQFDGFSANGTIDKAALNQFRQLYTQQANKVTSVDSFTGNAMSDQALLIDDPSASDTTTN